ncbi:MAG TPA: adenosine deaminase [Candidatus Saccharimonadales bacterium]|nr:adenosine deaminase [Candidatus Saccharimonadales bacterium]
MNSEFITRLPKAELHLHLEGSVDPLTLSQLSEKHHTPFPWSSNRYKPLPDSHRTLTLAECAALYNYEDFTGFLMAFKSVTERLRDPEDFELITYRLVEKLAAQGCLHAEVFVSVGVIFWRGQPFDPLFEGMERGRLRAEKDFGTTLLWIFDAVRHFGPEEGEKVLASALQHQSSSVIGIGIGGDERIAGPELFEQVYARAARHALRLSVHAGETVGPTSIYGALDILKAERLGHALHAAQDPMLVNRLVRDQVPLELCVTSNLRTSCCPDVSDHPLRRYFDAGALVTLNTDDPEMFQTTLVNEYQLAQDAFGFTNTELQQLAANSFRASWLPEERKRELLQLL